MDRLRRSARFRQPDAGQTYEQLAPMPEVRLRLHLLAEDDHNIDCRIDGIGSMKLKSEFMKKA